jgi:hypothetical protein
LPTPPLLPLGNFFFAAAPSVLKPYVNGFVWDKPVIPAGEAERQVPKEANARDLGRAAALNGQACP